LKDKIVALVSRITKIEPDVLTQESTTVLWDSFTHLEIIFALEEAFNITLNPEQIASMRTMDAVYGVIAAMTGKHDET